MKTLKWRLAVVLVLGVCVSTIMLRIRPAHPPATEADEPNPAVIQTETADCPSTCSTSAPVRKLFPALPLTPPKVDSPATDIAPESANMVQVGADQVLAKVNNQAILLNHLVPLSANGQEEAMTPEEFASRLDRAIEIEVTFQAAATQGVDLTPEQKQRVGGIARKHEATLRAYQLQGITWSSVTPAQVEFEKQLTAALLLQQNLVAIEASVAPASDPSVQSRYEQARRDVLSRLKANGNISISTVGF